MPTMLKPDPPALRRGGSPSVAAPGSPRGARRPRAFAFALTPLLAPALVACTTVQTTKPGVIGVDRKQRMSTLVSSADLEQGAATAYSQVLEAERKKGTLNTDTRTLATVRKVAQRLIPQVSAFRADARNWNWQVNLIESEQLNAWAMPGGKIAFYSGIIDKLDLQEDEIAAIMGHEIAHALREHSRERASEQALSSLAIGGAAVVGSVLTGVDLTGASDATRLVYNTTFGLKNSRLHETESDRIGVELAARAGYDPRAAIRVWQKMAKAAGGRGGPEFLSTHPSNESRIEDLRVYSERVMPLYRAAS